jgi:hypothetical protein
MTRSASPGGPTEEQQPGADFPLCLSAQVHGGTSLIRRLTGFLNGLAFSDYGSWKRMGPNRRTWAKELPPRGGKGKRVLGPE